MKEMFRVCYGDNMCFCTEWVTLAEAELIEIEIMEHDPETQTVLENKIS